VFWSNGVFVRLPAGSRIVPCCHPTSPFPFWPSSFLPLPGALPPSLP
jgi:hypothetical protein